MTNREEDENLIRRLMDSQSRHDWDEILRLLADDAVFDMPFIAEKYHGKEQILERWRPALERMEGVEFFDLAFSPMAEPGWYVATFRNRCKVKRTGMDYDQMYVSLFHVRNGKVAYFAEYFDTLRLALAQKRVRRIEEVPQLG
jgi:ketosteroid isomerase-like protein